MRNKRFRTGILALAVLAISQTCAADTDTTYDGLTICGYGKINYVAVTEYPDGFGDRFVLKVDSMPALGDYPKFQNENVIGIRDQWHDGEGVFRSFYVLMTGALFDALVQDKAVRILSDSRAKNGKCDAAIEHYEIKLCDSRQSCWDDSVRASEAEQTTNGG